MPVTVHEVAGATQFTGVASAGLFDPSVYGSEQTQIRVNSWSYHGTGTAPTFTLKAIDPENSGNEPLLFTGTANDYSVSGWNYLIPTGTDGTAWDLKFETTSKSATGWLTIDWDPVPTPT